ncbi:hypothetical protein COV61_00110 [Candidatus Micrarchaeota archaeon CG11_big_fil_rev_8_21_14_0_20_47_5]|nr:MAG: hypothetical protein AUJ17_01820 [Candidatus Micrarchaeota archaeon CG1_02_47_40]PIN84446.1 MAG: hypothetical protein COV61_00110 [Candidatus Micrarchaeota archaeon CG11_big_fil_rev_8_21_14_0_20_47_5]
MDWRIAAVAAMALLSVYSIVLKYFISDISTGREDFRAYIPAFFACALLLFGYFLLNIQNVKLGERTSIYHLALIPLLLLLSATTYLAYRDGPLTVVIPIMGLAMVGTALLAVFFLHEQLTPARILGIVLALVAIAVFALEKEANGLIRSVFGA